MMRGGVLYAHEEAVLEIPSGKNNPAFARIKKVRPCAIRDTGGPGEVLRVGNILQWASWQRFPWAYRYKQLSGRLLKCEIQ
jgi:hypothetical protein